MIPQYTEEEKKILKRYFSSVNSTVFALINLPEVIKGTLFSRYSRTAKDIRRLFLDEFYSNQDIAKLFINEVENLQEINVDKAEDFYERVLVGYGDDSVAELGGAHVAIEEISMLATKSIEEHRIGLSPLEKSTRYVYYDKKINGEYLYYKDSKILNSKFSELYIDTNEMLFDTYSKIVREIQPILKKVYSGDDNEIAYKSSIRAKACDIARSLLPLSAKTNMGVYGDGRAFEYLLTTLLNDSLIEVREIAEQLDSALKTVISAFVKRASNIRGEKYREYLNNTITPFKKLKNNFSTKLTLISEPQVRLVDYDADAEQKIVAALLFQFTDLDYCDAYNEAGKLSKEEIEALMRQLGEFRENRHHKPLRVVEEPYFAFEIIADWGVYKDLMRHRILTRHKKMFTSEMGYFVPNEIELTGFKNLFTQAMDQATDSFLKIQEHFPYEAQYLVTHGSYTSFYEKMNLKALTHLVELRSIPQGHPSYRKVVQKMANLVSEKFPLFGEHIFKFVDYNDYELERLETFRKLEKKTSIAGINVFEE